MLRRASRRGVRRAAAGDLLCADAYRRAGGKYYPKLQVAVPFTPVPGPRLLLAPEADQAVHDMLIAGMVEIADRRDVSSLHATFLREPEWRRLGEAGFLRQTR